jgi:hypothetical protein
MLELYQEAIAPHNLPLSLLLSLVVLYWLLVIFGLFGLETELPDLGEPGADLPTEPGGTPLGGAWLSAGRLIGLAQVPLVVWGSFFVLFLWGFCVIGNFYYNGTPATRSLGTAAWIFGGGIIISLILTKLVTLPVGRLFSAMNEADNESVSVLGQTATVATIELTTSAGQVQLGNVGAPVLLNARLEAGHAALPKGATVVIVSASPDGLFHWVKPV